MYEKKKLVGAICAAPLILRDAGISRGVKLTSYPSVKKELPEVEYQEDPVVVDGNIVTSRSPGTAMAFALKLAEILAGKEQAKTVARAVLAPLD